MDSHQRRRRIGSSSLPKRQPPIGDRVVRSQPLSDTLEGIKFEVEKLRGYVKYYSQHDDLVVKTVEQIAHACQSKDKNCLAETLFNWVKSRFIFVNDPYGGEKIKTTNRQLRDLETPRDVLAVILAPLVEMNQPEGSVLPQLGKVIVRRSDIDLKWVPMAKSVGDCIPLSQKIILRDRLTNRYAIREVGSIRNEVARYDALSYNFESQVFEFKPIVAWHDKGMKDVYAVKLNDGCDFRCTWNHNLFFFRGSTNGNKVLDMGPLSAVEDRRSKFQMKPQIPRAKEIPALGTVQRPIDLLWLEGLWVAEGWKDEGHVNVANKDKGVIDRVLSILNANSIPHGETPRKDGVTTVRILSSAFKEYLRSGFGDSSFSKQFPEGYLSLSKEHATVLIDGYAAGDAYIPKRGGWLGVARLIHNTSSGILASQLLFIHHLMGRPLSPWLQLHHGGSGTKPIWRLTEYIRGKTQSRSKERLPNILTPTIRSVTPVGVAETCDITVMDNGNFVTDQGVVVKNCDEASTFMATMLAAGGIKSRFILGGRPGESGACEWHHIWAQGLTPAGWIDMDVSEPDSTYGWSFPFKCHDTVEIFDTEDQNTVVQAPGVQQHREAAGFPP